MERKGFFRRKRLPRPGRKAASLPWRERQGEKTDVVEKEVEVDCRKLDYLLY
jgi:hypothetical protein